MSGVTIKNQGPLAVSIREYVGKHPDGETVYHSLGSGMSVYLVVRKDFPLAIMETPDNG